MDLTREDQKLILHALHNAWWMTENEAAMKQVDQHIAVIDPADRERLRHLILTLARAAA